MHLKCIENIQINKLISSIIKSKQFLESDNPGLSFQSFSEVSETDSEVRKILTLHIPITEYDTLGSESDNDVASRTVNQSKYRQRGKKCLLYKQNKTN